MKQLFILLLSLLMCFGAGAKNRHHKAQKHSAAHKRSASAAGKKKRKGKQVASSRGHHRGKAVAHNKKGKKGRHGRRERLAKKDRYWAPTPLPQPDTTVVFPAEKVKSFLSTLANELGKPYIPGSDGPRGFDCSGLMKFGFFIMGIGMPRTADGLSKLGETISFKDLHPGDLLFFSGSRKRSKTIGHVGAVYKVDSGKVYMIHASREGVNIVDVANSDYYKSRLKCARRVFSKDTVRVKSGKG